MKTEVINQQKQHPLDLHGIRRFLKATARQVARTDRATRWREIVLVLMDDAGIAQVNRTCFGKSTATDVISFRYAPAPEEEGCITGEVLVNVQRAHEEGTRRGNRDHELAFYIAHGCLHLTGADDATPSERTAMHRIQNAWIAETANDMPIRFFQPLQTGQRIPS